ncbi:phage antirepressor N-terminal domain-containing protein [Pantoea endophytica]|uniref:Phage antirepressor N-terminal domain-containing protein n=1 Tax=Pantoea sp. BJ2 TaxID=3141322 RepID=A0AAU7U3E0_9GAMM
MKNRLITIPFAHDSMIATTIRRRPYVAIKPICEAAGLDWPYQRKRILRDDILSEDIVITTVMTPQGQKKMLFLPLEQLNGWLLRVNVKRVKPELRDTLHIYKRKCHHVLFMHFFGKTVRERKRVEKKQKYNLNLLSEHFNVIQHTWTTQIQPVLNKLESPVSDRLHDRFNECSALLSMLDRKTLRSKK